MVQIEYSSNFIKKLKKIKKLDEKLFQKVTLKLNIFTLDPTHPSLRLHKLTGELEDAWSISITREVRIVFYYRKDNQELVAVMMDLGTHDQVYRK